jgi:hypothetical protein
MDTKKLIHLVHLRRGLWDREHPAYGKRSAASILWKEVAREFNSTSDEVNTTWQRLRHTFSSKIRKMRMNGCGDDDLKFVNNKSLRRFRSLYFLMSQFTTTASSSDISAKETKISGFDQTDARDGELQSSQHSFRGPCHEKQQNSPHVSEKEIQTREKKTSRDDQKDLRAGTLKTSQYSIKGPSHEREQISSHVSTADILPREKKSSRDDQTDSSDERLSSSQHTAKRPCHEIEQISFHVSTANNPPGEKNILRADQMGSQTGSQESSHLSCSGKEITPRDKVLKRKYGDDVLDYCDNSTLSHFKRVCLRKQQFTSHERTRDFPPEEGKDNCHIQVEKLEGGVVISQDDPSGKECKPGAILPSSISDNSSEEPSGDSNLPPLTGLCRQKDQFMSHASSKDLPLKKRKYLGDTQTDTRDGEVESSQYSAARKKFKTHVANSSAETETPILKVTEDEYKTMDEDISFFESLIPHIKTLSPARKMLLRIKTQELIYNFIYNEGVQIQQ